jgi:prepilin-type N-terminal cleavage/methylation domain-containing protein
MVTRKQHGFTIIEVVLVLAIAGLIFLMVFIALPALQRGQRDTQRRSSLSTFLAQVTQYQANTKGTIPAEAIVNSTSGSFITGYMASNWTDPSTNSPFSPATNNAGVDTATTPGEYYYSITSKCNGSAIATISPANNRAFAVRMKLEGAGVICMDNQ